MNTKQKLFTFTSIGTVFATAIAFVAIAGARNLAQLKADNEIVYGTPYTLIIDKDSVTDFESEDNYHILTVETKTKSGWDFTTDDTVEAGGELKSEIGATSIIDFKESGTVYPYIRFNFTIKGVHSLPVCELKGNLETANITVSGLDKRTANDVYSVVVYIDGEWLENVKGVNYYSGFTLTSIEFTYVC